MSKMLTKMNLLKLKNLSRRYSFRELYYKVGEKLSDPHRNYSKNVKEFLIPKDKLEEQRQTCFSKMPTISIVVPTYETDEEFLKQMVDSVRCQTYERWELCIADGSSSNKVKEILERYYPEEARILYKKLDKNEGIAENTNQGFKMAAGQYVGLLDHDDLLHQTSLYEIVKRINETDADMLYTDEDKTTADTGVFLDPHFKLDFNRELLLCNNYICHFLVVSRELLAKTGGLRSEFDGAQDFDFILRCSENAEKIEHIAKILYHWRVHAGSTAGNTDSKLYAYTAGKRAIEACLQRHGWSGTVMMLNDLGFYQTRYEVLPKKKLAVAFWGTECREFAGMWAGLRSDLQKKGCEILEHAEETGNADYVLVLNRGCKACSEEGISILLGNCMRNEIGVTGVKTIAKGKVLQCGYRKIEGVFEPQFAGLSRHYKGYFRRAVLSSETDAVSNIMAVLPRNIWKNLQECGIDLEDLSQWKEWCFEIKQNGSRIIVEPQAEVEL